MMQDDDPTRNEPKAQGQSVASGRGPTADVAAFLERARQRAPANLGSGSLGRLIFGLDATASRQPAWNMAQQLQGGMFEEAGRIGSLEIQLVYFRGFSECRASKWITDTARLNTMMNRISCVGGQTQIERVLSHAVAETRLRKVQALVYVGDAMEEPIDRLCAEAGELALLGVPVFLFQEGYNPATESGFREIARITKGAWCRFDPSAADQLAALLRAVAAYAAGGRKALAALAAQGGSARLLLQQISG